MTEHKTDPKPPEKPKLKPGEPHPLAYPVTVEGKVISEVRFRRAKVKDIGAIQRAEREGGEYDASVMAVACLTDLPVQTVEEMDFDDFITVSELVEGFIPDQVVAAAKAAMLARRTGNAA